MVDSFYTPFNPFGQLGAPISPIDMDNSVYGPMAGTPGLAGFRQPPETALFGLGMSLNPELPAAPAFHPGSADPFAAGPGTEWYEDPAVLQALTGAMGGLSGYLDARRYNRIADSARQHLAGRERAAEANWQSRNPVRKAEGGALGYLAGGTAGQDDKIPAMLSDGEYVFDADTVAALGDGNNAAGASALDQMRENIRRHKRSASPKKIPPKAKKPEAYMKKGA